MNDSYYGSKGKVAVEQRNKRQWSNRFVVLWKTGAKKDFFPLG